MALSVLDLLKINPFYSTNTTIAAQISGSGIFKTHQHPLEYRVFHLARKPRHLSCKATIVEP